MDARLVEIEDRRRVSVTPIGAELRIGRDPTSDLISDYARVSRFHCVIRASEGRHVIVDAGSTNGTTVNGIRVKDTPVVLESGDVVELSAEVAFVYETGSTREATLWILLALAALGLLLGIAGFLAYQRFSADPVLEQASEIASAGATAAKGNDRGETRRALRWAAGLLYREGRLDDVSRGDALRVGLERLTRHANTEVDYWQLLEAATPATGYTYRAPLVGPECRLDTGPPEAMPGCLSQWLARILSQLDIASGAPADLASRVGLRMLVEHAALAAGLEQAQQQAADVARALESQQLPGWLHYLALVQSGYQNARTDELGRAGLWQLDAATAREHGLAVSSEEDARNDAYLASQAAGAALLALRREFGGMPKTHGGSALMLAIAAFGSPEAFVRSALGQLDDPFGEDAVWRLDAEELQGEAASKQLEGFLAAVIAGEGGLPSLATLDRAGF